MNKKGATSILVIFMLIVLVTLGAFTIVSSNLNYKLSQRVSKWSKDYYDMEKISEKFIMNIDNLLIKSEKMSIDYLLGNKSDEIPASFELMINNIDFKNNSDDEKINETLKELYKYFVTINLDEVKNQFPNAVFKKENENIFIDTTIAHEEKDNLFLDVSLKISLDNFVFTNENGVYRLKNDKNTSRYSVVKRNEWQQINQNEVKYELWDGGLN